MIDWKKRKEEIENTDAENICDCSVCKNEFYNKIITQEKDIIHDVIFKMYCPLVAKGVDKEMLKEIAYDLMKDYGIKKEAMDE